MFRQIFIMSFVAKEKTVDVLTDLHRSWKSLGIQIDKKETKYPILGRKVEINGVDEMEQMDSFNT